MWLQQPYKEKVVWTASRFGYLDLQQPAICNDSNKQLASSYKCGRCTCATCIHVLQEYSFQVDMTTWVIAIWVVRWDGTETCTTSQPHPLSHCSTCVVVWTAHSMGQLPQQQPWTLRVHTFSPWQSPNTHLHNGCPLTLQVCVHTPQSRNWLEITCIPLWCMCIGSH